MLASLAHQAPRAQKALASVGISGKEAGAALQDPISFLGKLNEKFQTKGFDEAKRLSVLVRVFGREVAPAAAALLEAGSAVGADGSTAFERMQVAMDNAKGSTERFARTVENTTSGKLKLFESQMDAIKVQLGEAFVPTLHDLTRALGPVITDLGGWIKENPRLTATLGRVAIGAAGVLGALASLGLAVSSFVSASVVLGPVLRTSLIPLRLYGAGLGKLATKLDGTETRLGRTGAAFTRFAGVASAALAGWEVGRFLDEALGKMLALRGGMVSTELALQAGESQGFNTAMLNIAETFGIDSLKEVAQGNMQTTELRENMARERKSREDRAAKPPPAEVAVNVQVKDERTIVHTKTAPSAGAKPRVGTSVP